MSTAPFTVPGRADAGMAVASVGDSAASTLAVDGETIARYAALVGDDNPLHVEPEYAAESLFDGRVAHGMLVAGVVSAALADLPGDVVYLSQEVRFENPVEPGDTVVAEATVVEALGDDRLRVETVAETDAGVVLSGEAVVLSLPHDGA